MDLNGDLKIDLFGVASSSDSTFKAWQNVWNISQPDGPIFNLYASLPFVSLPNADIIHCHCSTDPKMSGSHCKLSNPHSNAAVDLNGDCLAGMYFLRSQ